MLRRWFVDHRGLLGGGWFVLGGVRPNLAPLRGFLALVGALGRQWCSGFDLET